MVNFHPDLLGFFFARTVLKQHIHYDEHVVKPIIVTAEIYFSFFFETQ